MAKETPDFSKLDAALEGGAENQTPQRARIAGRQFTPSPMELDRA